MKSPGQAFGFIAMAALLANGTACSQRNTSATSATTLAENEGDDDGENRALRAHLVDAAGNSVGTVLFTRDRGGVRVSWSLSGLTTGFHGIHVHANDNPANGDGCVPPTFASADGHLNLTGTTHGAHTGDMPSAQARDDGTARASFVTDSFTLADIKGRAVILHTLSDNFGNVPVGANADQYTANSAAATTLTQTTGNADGRFACGVIQ